MKQFESIFLSDISPTGARARVFTVEEELPFAGHPVLGAGSGTAPHPDPGSQRKRLATATSGGDADQHAENREPLSGRNEPRASHLGRHHPLGWRTATGSWLDLAWKHRISPADSHRRVISTGLPYLILPVHAHALARAAINGADLETLLAACGAKFVLVLDAANRELRTWDNLGRVEDVATGSAAGPVGAYLFTHYLADPALPIELSQGRFAGRPSTLSVRRDGNNNLLVSGEVAATPEHARRVSKGGGHFSLSRTLHLFKRVP